MSLHLVAATVARYARGMLRSSAAIALALAAALAACAGEPEPSVRGMPRPDERGALLVAKSPAAPVASYRIAATYDDEKHRIVAKQTLTWVNTGSAPVTALPFHLYMNAFKNESSVFMQESNGRHRGARAADGGWGWIDVTAVSVDGGDDLGGRLEWPAPDETVVRVPLDKAVPPGGRAEVAMSFEVQLPVVFARTGYLGHFTMAGQWFPKVGVLVGDAWHCEPFHLHSEFFADFGSYEVALTVPDTVVVAATGVLTGAVDDPGPTRTLTYRAEAVHDFAWMADPFMETMRARARTDAGEVEVVVYFREPQRAFAERHLATGVRAIEVLSRLLVAYPWSRMSIVDPPTDAVFGAGGMEYPTLVTTGGDTVIAPEGVRVPEYVTIHEVGHNWFQGMLASNEVDEAWLDEGLNEYVDALVLHEMYGREESGLDLWGLYGDILETRSWGATFGDAPDPATQPSHRFVDALSYGNVTYMKVAAALSTLEHVVGSARFRAALGAYAREMAFRHPTEADLVRVLERELGQDVDWFLEPALRRVGSAELGVRSIRCTRKQPPSGVFGRGPLRRAVSAGPAGDAPTLCAVVIENLGAVPVPVEVEVTFADGRSVRRRWDDRGGAQRWIRFDIEDAQPVVEVEIDPDRLVLLDDGGLRRSLRVEPEVEPVARASARAQFFTQTAMQVLGL